MDPRRRISPLSLKQSDAYSSYALTRTHEALLRSTGHLFRDGRYTSDEDADTGFFAYYSDDPLCIDGNRTFQVGEYIAQGTFGPSLHTCNWRNSVCRGFSTLWDGYRQELPEVVEPAFEDYVFELNTLGTNFIRNTRPGNPAAALGQFTGELHQLPRIPLLLHRRLSDIRDLSKATADQYLNIEFGWKPFVRDVIGVYELQQRLQSVLNKLRHDNGLKIRRRSKKKVTNSDPVVVIEGSMSRPFGWLGDVSKGGADILNEFFVGGPLGPLVSEYIGGQCDYRYTTVRSTTTWQCGTWQYYVPDIGSDRWTERAKSALFGTNLTPSLAWELIPWSWLIDWFSNVGDIISNMSENAVDNEVLTNCYSMMENRNHHDLVISNHWEESISSEPGDPTYLALPAGSGSVSYARLERSRFRRQASPYGFGLKWPDFTARQLAILAALAIKRV